MSAAALLMFIAARDARRYALRCRDAPCRASAEALHAFAAILLHAVIYVYAQRRYAAAA